MDEEYKVILSEAEILILMHSTSEFYKSISDDDINDHRCSVLLNAFRKMKKSMTDKENYGSVLGFNVIMLGSDERLKQ